MQRLLAIAVCAGLLSFPAFSAESSSGNEVVEPARLLSTFADICLKNLGNPEAQAAVAQASPFSMAKQESTQEETRLRSKAFGLGIKSDGSHDCSITAEISPESTLESVKSLFIKEMGANDGQPMPSADSRYWLVEFGSSKQPYAVMLKVSDASGSKLGTFMISKTKVQR